MAGPQGEALSQPRRQCEDRAKAVCLHEARKERRHLQAFLRVERLASGCGDVCVYRVFLDRSMEAGSCASLGSRRSVWAVGLRCIDVVHAIYHD